MGDLVVVVHGEASEAPARVAEAAAHGADARLLPPSDESLPSRLRAQVTAHRAVLALNSSCRVIAPVTVAADRLTVFSVLPGVQAVPWAPEIERATLREGVFLRGVALFVHDAPSLALLDWWHALWVSDPTSLAVRRVLDLAPGTFGARMCTSWRSFMKVRPVGGSER